MAIKTKNNHENQWLSNISAKLQKLIKLTIDSVILRPVIHTLSPALEPYYSFFVIKVIIRISQNMSMGI